MSQDPSKLTKEQLEERLADDLARFFSEEVSPEEIEEELKNLELQTEEEEDEEPSYTEDTWRGFKIFRCAMQNQVGGKCFYSCSREDEMKLHVWKTHTIPNSLAERAVAEQMRKPLDAELLDASGKPIYERDMTPEEKEMERLDRLPEPPPRLN